MSKISKEEYRKLIDLFSKMDIDSNLKQMINIDLEDKRVEEFGDVIFKVIAKEYSIEYLDGLIEDIIEEQNLDFTPREVYDALIKHCEDKISGS